MFIRILIVCLLTLGTLTFSVRAQIIVPCNIKNCKLLPNAYKVLDSVVGIINTNSNKYILLHFPYLDINERKGKSLYKKRFSSIIKIEQYLEQQNCLVGYSSECYPLKFNCPYITIEERLFNAIPPPPFPILK